MTIARTLVSVLLIAGFATYPSFADDSLPIDPKSQKLLEVCLTAGTPWEQCFDGAKASEPDNEFEFGSTETCVRAGGPIDYCFPYLKGRESAHASDRPGLWFYLRPRSLWTSTPYDLLAGHNR